MRIPLKLSNVAESVILATDASATINATGGNAMNFIGVVVARRGRPNKLLTVDPLWQSVLGKPYHMREGAAAESSRHIEEAVKGGKGYVVRVVPSTARYPVITLRKKIVGEVVESATYNTHGTLVPLSKDEGEALEWSFTALPYGTAIEQSDGSDSVSFYLIDGDNELERSIVLEPLDADEYGAGFFELSLFEKSADGFSSLLESHIISLDPEAVDINSNKAFVESQLDNSSNRIRSVVNFANKDLLTGFVAMKFAGGTSGSIKDISSDDYLKAIAVLSKEDPDYQAVCALGCYDDIALGKLAELAHAARVSLYYDVEPNLSYDAALTRQIALAMSTHYACCYHLPYSATDPFFGSKSSWGLSGFAFAAKATGVAFSAPVGSWHLTPAGMTRATISRPNLEIHENAGIPDYDKMVKARINKVGLNSQGQLMIDDALTCRAKSDDLLYEGITSVDNYFKREWYKLTLQFKHDPTGDAIDGLRKGMSAILRNAETAGLVTKTTIGGDAWALTVKLEGKDLVVAEWATNNQGSMRRTSGQCQLKSFDGA